MRTYWACVLIRCCRGLLLARMPKVWGGAWRYGQGRFWAIGLGGDDCGGGGSWGDILDVVLFRPVVGGQVDDGGLTRHVGAWKEEQVQSPIQKVHGAHESPRTGFTLLVGYPCPPFSCFGPFVFFLGGFWPAKFKAVFILASLQMCQWRSRFLPGFRLHGVTKSGMNGCALYDNL